MRILLVAVMTVGLGTRAPAFEGLANPPESVFGTSADPLGTATMIAQLDLPTPETADGGADEFPVPNFSGVINATTKSGGNQFSGSLRTTFDRSEWEPRVIVNVGQEFYQSGTFKTIAQDGTFVDVGVSIPVFGPDPIPRNLEGEHPGAIAIIDRGDPGFTTIRRPSLTFDGVFRHTDVNVRDDNRINQFGTPANPFGIDGHVNNIEGWGLCVGPNVLFPVTVGRQQFVFSTGVRGTFTAWNPDITVDQRFLPNNPTVFVAPGFDPGGQEFGGGVEVRVGLETVLVDRIRVGVGAGLGKQWTDVVQGETSTIDSASVFGLVTFRFGPTFVNSPNYGGFSF